jgi:hypothetical protein
MAEHLADTTASAHRRGHGEPRLLPIADALQLADTLRFQAG